MKIGRTSHVLSLYQMKRGLLEFIYENGSIQYVDIRGFSDVQDEVEILRKSLYFGFVDVPHSALTVNDVIRLLLPEDNGSVRIERNGDMYFVYQLVDDIEMMTISFFLNRETSKFRLLFDAFDSNNYDERTMKFSM